VSARAVANSYSQVLGQIFTAELKPFEVEVLVAQVGHEGEENEMFHILYDGSVADEANFVAMGGQSEALTEAMRRSFRPGASLAEALRLGVDALGEIDKREVPAKNLEVAVLDRSRERRKFRRLTERELAELLGSTARGAGSSNGSSPGSGPETGPASGPETVPPAEPGPPGET
jgi:proteasome alpha subunit